MRKARRRAHAALATALLLVAAVPAGAVTVPVSSGPLPSGAPPAPVGGAATRPVTTGPATTTPVATTPVATTPPRLPRNLRGTPVMGRSLLSATQLAAWYRSNGKQERTTVSVEVLARVFVEEGAAQGVRADVAFVQSIVETGWFEYQGSMVRATDNNFSGLGACDTCNRGRLFRTARIGVRAQIQHLLAYAEPLADQRLARPLADPRFRAVSPWGKAPAWEMMGSGNWASGRGYGRQVLGLWKEALAFSGVTPPAPVLITSATGLLIR